MNDRVDDAGEPVVWLDQIRIGDADRVGEKAATLGELVQYGLLVPPAFVLTAGAYRAVHTSGERSANAPPGIRASIATAYAELGRRVGRDDVPVAVRASVIAEQITFGPTARAPTPVTGVDQLVDAVECCWAALFNDRAQLTRTALGGPSEPAMAVIVQELAAGTRSGTAYTVDPVRRDDGLVRVTAAFGPDAAPTPPRLDSYLLCRDTNELVEANVVPKEHPAADYRRVLSDAEAALVAATAGRVEQCLGQPQAVDWLLSPGGEVIVLETCRLRTSEDISIAG